MKVIISDNITSWIENLFKERICNDVSIVQSGDYYICHFKSCNKTLKFGKIDRNFYFLDYVLQYNEFNCISENLGYPILPIIPAPNLCLDNSLIEITESCITFHYDILGFAFWTMNRLEEASMICGDEHSRIISDQTYSFKYGYYDRPVIDEWFFVIRDVVSNYFSDLLLVEHNFQFELTHDVDNISMFAGLRRIAFLKVLVKNFILERNDSNVFEYIGAYFSRRSFFCSDPYNTFDMLIDLAQRNNIRSTFFFITKNYGHPYDSSYEFDSKEVNFILEKIHKSGSNIGLHSSYYASEDEQLLKDEYNILADKLDELVINDRIIGSRSHYLRWKHNYTLIKLNDLGLYSDSTLGFANQSGFRCGTCFDFQGYDLERDFSLNIRIKPLIAMDTTLFSPAYLGLRRKVDALNYLKELKGKCVAVDGCFSLLWHNCQLVSSRDREVLLEIIKK